MAGLQRIKTNIIQNFKLAFTDKYVTVRNTANCSQQKKLSASVMLPAEANGIQVTVMLIKQVSFQIWSSNLTFHICFTLNICQNQAQNLLSHHLKEVMGGGGGGGVTQTSAVINR